MAGFKHLIECHCYLSIFKKKEKIINHRFPVYSRVNEMGILEKKIVKCNNCEACHNIIGYGKSEIIPGKDDSNIVVTIDDIKNMIPKNISDVLVNYKSDISNWEHVLDIISDGRWQEPIVLKREIISDITQVKVMIINKDMSINIVNEKIENVLDENEK